MKRLLYLTVALLVTASCTARPVGGPEGWKVYGPMGPEGPPGIAGPAGPQGPQGIAGLTGAAGAAGVAGAAGAAGSAGLLGAQGMAGARGADLVWRQFGDVGFDLDKADLRLSDADKVSQLAVYLKENSTFRVELEGFADPRGSDTYNLKLSTQRVNAVRDALIAAGVQKERILIGAYGKLNLKCTQGTEECLQQNRRVEMIVLPTADLKATSLRMGNGK